MSQRPALPTARTWQEAIALLDRRIAARRGKKRALMALGHTILIMVYDVLTRKQPDQDLGRAYFQRLVHRLERLGYQVSLQPSMA
jgi:transposase